jgi:hypothetical protein
MRTPENQQPIREAAGVFFDSDHSQAAIDELLASGFRHENIGIPSREHRASGRRANCAPDLGPSLRRSPCRCRRSWAAGATRSGGLVLAACCGCTYEPRRHPRPELVKFAKCPARCCANLLIARDTAPGMLLVCQTSRRRPATHRIAYSFGP